MNYFYELDRINEEIQTIKNHCEYLLDNMGDIEQQNNLQLKELNQQLNPGKADYNSIHTKDVLRREILQLQQDILALKDKREDVIRTILNASKISVQEVICLMDKFKSYHRTEMIGKKTLIVPQDFYLLRSGANSVMGEEQLKEMASEYQNVGLPLKKSSYTAPLYKQTSNGILENNYLLTIVAGLEINDLEGIQIYKREGNEVVFNGKILNLFPYDVVAFLDYLVISRFENAKLTMEEAWKQYSKTKVLTFSKEDPALEDIYRTR